MSQRNYAFDLLEMFSITHPRSWYFQLSVNGLRTKQFKSRFRSRVQLVKEQSDLMECDVEIPQQTRPHFDRRHFSLKRLLLPRKGDF